MDCQQWIDCDWKNPDDWKEFETQACKDIKEQLEREGLKLVKTIPNVFRLGVIASTEDDKRLIHITTPDVRKGKWSKEVKLRRMSSLRDWTGDEYHFCDWNSIGKCALLYLSPEYDDEAF